jgi:hypothetical protein
LCSRNPFLSGRHLCPRNAKKTLYIGADGKPDKSKPYASVYINDDLSPVDRKKGEALRKVLKDIKAKDPTAQGSIRNGTLLIRKGGKVINKYTCQDDGTVNNGTSSPPDGPAPMDA